MAACFLLPHLSPSLSLQREKFSPAATPLPPSSLSSSSFPLTRLEPPLARDEQGTGRPPGGQYSNKQKNVFYVNLGIAVRTLREDLPLLFSKDLNYDIYREDVTFVDPLNTFVGIENYRLMFWALRFHGRILFREISLDVFRVWQPAENIILIRWNLRGVPRVPWEARGEFQGTSRYKLDRNGKIYEHKVDNLAFNFPQPVRPAHSVLDLVAACPASPNLTFLWGSSEQCSSLWLEFYRAVRDTVDQGGGYLVRQEALVTCS